MRQLKIKKLPTVFMLLLVTLFLISCVPRSDQENRPSAIPFRVVLLPLTSREVNVGEAVEIDMEIQNTTTQPVQYTFTGLYKFLFVNHYYEDSGVAVENDLSIKQGRATVRIYPTFYEESLTQLETTFPAGAVEHVKFNVVFSQAGTYLIQGAIRIQLPSGIPNILTEVIILSPQYPIWAREKNNTQSSSFLLALE
jgi:hypothetical protein